MAQASVRHVFMSYSRRDEEVMRRVTTFLRNKGINVWVDNEKLVPGTPIWEEAIEKAIIGASATVVLLSPDAKDSVWVRRELSYTEHYRKRIFPVLVRGNVDSSMPLRLITNQYIDIQKNESMALNSLAVAMHSYFQELGVEERKASEELEKLRHAPNERKTSLESSQAASQPEPVQTEMEKDDLKEIKGIGPVVEKRLNNAGIHTFEALAGLTSEEIQVIFGPAQRLVLDRNLIEQAKELAQQKKGRTITK